MGRLANMAQWFAKAHAYVFYVLRTSFKAIMDDGWEDWKAITIIGVAMISVVFVAQGIAETALGHRLHWLSNWPERILLGAVLVGANHYTLVADRKWSRFEPGFRHRSKAARIFGLIAVWLGILLTVIAAAEVASMIRDLHLPA
jgi:hypothetical protein